jgi:hypothetical protein
MSSDIEQFLVSNDVLLELNVAACQLSSHSIANILTGVSKSRSLRKYAIHQNNLCFFIFSLTNALV